MLHDVFSYTCVACTQVDVEKVAGFEEYKGRCQPVFLFYKVGHALNRCHAKKSVTARYCCIDNDHWR